MAEDSPFGLAESEAGSTPTEMPSSSGEAPRNPFQSKSAKVAESSSEAPPFEMAKAGEGGFEMKGISASEAPVGEIDAAPLGKDDADDSPFAGGDSKAMSEATNPFGASKEAPTAEKSASDRMRDFGGMPESKPPAAMDEPAFPAAAASARPARREDAPAAKTPDPVARETPMASAPAAPVNSIKQLAVRAIFGVDRELSRNELIQRAKTLPGIRNLSSVSGEELKAMETVQDCMSNLGFGQKEDILLTCPNGMIEFVTMGASAIAVVRDSDWKPGVRETLIIIAQEIDQL